MNHVSWLRRGHARLFLICVLGFAVFGLGSLLFAAVIFPLCRVWPGGPPMRILRAQKAIRYAFRLFLWFLTMVGGVESVRVVGGERLQRDQRCLIIANHPTLIDVVVLISILGPVDCIVKGGLKSNVFVQEAVDAAGYIANDEGPELVEEAAERLRQGRTMLLFPEGTRSPKGGLGPFKRGFAHIALAAGCDIVPVVIRCEPAALGKGQSLFRMPASPLKFLLTVGEPITPKDHVEPSDSAPVAARKIEALVRRYYEEKLTNGNGEAGTRA